MDKMEKQKKGKGLPAAEVSLFCQQAAMILKSGIPLYDGIEVLYRNYKETEYGEAFGVIYEGVRSGGSLYEGVKAAGFFPAYMVNMIRVGEMAGKLDDVLESLGVYYEKEDRIQSSVKSAVAYPLVLVVMMAVVISILVIKVLPVFSEVFESLGTGLSGTSSAVLSGGVVIGRAVLFVVALFLLAALALYLTWRTGGQEKVIELGCRLLPPIGSLRQKQTAQRFAAVVSMVMSSGYSLESALDLIPGLLPDERNAAKARECKAAMEENGDFAAAVERAGLFSPLYLKMIRVGAEAGRTDQVMERVAQIYENEVEEGIQGLVSWIEPVLVGVLTLVIGGILLSVMLPLVSIMASIG